MQSSLAVAEHLRRFSDAPLRVAVKCDGCAARAKTVCSSLATADLERLSSIAVAMSIDPGQGFIDEGGNADHFFNVTAGTAKLFKLLPDGRRLITGFADPGHFLGLAVSSTYAYSAEAVDGIRICRYSRSRFKELLADFPAMKTRLLQEASNELAEAQEQMLLLGRKTARERVASFVIGRASASSPRLGAGPVSVVLPMTRNDIADYLGLSVETVSRTFTGLARDGLIRVVAATRVTIPDHAALKDVAAGVDRHVPPR